MQSIPTQQHPSSGAVESGVTVTAERGNEQLHSAKTTAGFYPIGPSPCQSLLVLVLHKANLITIHVKEKPFM